MSLISLGRAIQTGTRFAKGLGRFDPGLRTIDKFAPPHLRKPLRGLYKAGQAGILGKDLISIAYDYMTAEDSPGNGAPPVFKQYASRKTYKTRHRPTRRYCIKRKLR